MLDAGADAVLVGMALMRANDIEQKVRLLVNAR
jgi:indole-3-glycerol phosphate synthase